MSGTVVRKIRPGDGEGCARAWLDAGRYYVDLVPEVIHEPTADGLVEWFEAAIAEATTAEAGAGAASADAAEDRDGDMLWLVAESDGEVIGMIEASMERARPDGRWQLQRDLSRDRLVINALAVVDEHRRRGVGTILMTAAEEWGRRNGAVVAVTNTNLSSPLSVPFYEDRMGYLRQAVILRKRL